MASLQERSGSFRFIFLRHGKQQFVTIGRVSQPKADASSAQVEYPVTTAEATADRTDAW